MGTLGDFVSEGGVSFGMFATGFLVDVPAIAAMSVLPIAYVFKGALSILNKDYFGGDKPGFLENHRSVYQKFGQE